MVHTDVDPRGLAQRLPLGSPEGKWLPRLILRRLQISGNSPNIAWRAAN